jgi:hypothetical protein
MKKLNKAEDVREISTEENIWAKAGGSKIIKKLKHVELIDLYYSSRSTSMMIKSMRIGWVGRVERAGGEGKACRVLMEKA